MKVTSSVLLHTITRTPALHLSLLWSQAQCLCWFAQIAAGLDRLLEREWNTVEEVAAASSALPAAPQPSPSGSGVLLGPNAGTCRVATASCGTFRVFKRVKRGTPCIIEVPPAERCSAAARRRSPAAVAVARLVRRRGGPPGPEDTDALRPLAVDGASLALQAGHHSRLWEHPQLPPGFLPTSGVVLDARAPFVPYEVRTSVLLGLSPAKC